MIVKDFISNDIPYLKKSDTIEYALLVMEDYGVRNLPIVENKKLSGYALRSLLESLDSNLTLETLKYGSEPVSIDPNHSVISCLKSLFDNQFDILAVSSKDEFFGIVWSQDILNGLGNSITAQSDGSALLIRCSVFNYSITEIGRLIETEDGKILGLWTWQHEENQDIDILLKLNIRHIDNISQILHSNGYTILNKINQQSDDLFEERYKSLINYLDI